MTLRLFVRCTTAGMEFAVVVLAVLGYFAAVVCSEGEKGWGPFDVELGEFGKCAEEGTGDIVVDNLDVKMTSKDSMIITFDATNKVEFSDDITVVIGLSTFDEDKKTYDEKSMKLPLGPVCQVFETYFPNTTKKLFQSLGVEGCPIKPNTWHVKQFPFEMALPMSQGPYKKLQTDVMFQKDGKLLYCIRAQVALVPEGTVKYPKAK